MRKASAAKQGQDRRARIAAQRAAGQRTRTRNRLLIAGGAIIVVVAVVVALVVTGGNSPAGGSGPGTPPTGSALASLVTTTWTFAHASYTSKYLAFVPVETYTNIPDPSTGTYTPLQTPTAEQQALLTKYDTAYGGAIPFLDFGNKYLSVGASYDPGVLAGKTWAQIAAGLHDPASPVAAGVDGTANYLTAAICGLTNDQPAFACTAVVKSLRSKF
jgi:hypothetical protein